VATGVGKGVKAAGNVAGKIPAIEAGLNKLTPFRDIRNLPEKYQELAQIRNMETRASRSLAFHDVENAIKPILQNIQRSGGDVHGAMKAAMRIADESDPAVDDQNVMSLVKYIQDFGRQRAEKEIAAGVLDPGSIRKNYVPKYFTKGSQAPLSSTGGVITEAGFKQAGKYPSFAAAEAAGEAVDYNLLRVLGKRQQSGDREIIYQKFAKELFSPESAEELKDLYKPIPSGGFNMKDRLVPTTPDGRQYVKIHPKVFDEQTRELFGKLVFHPDMAPDMERMLTIANQPDALYNTFDKVMGYWKTMATVMRPAFIQRNVMSNIFMSLAGGETRPDELVSAYGKAFNLLRNPAEAIKNPEFLRAKELGITSTEFGSVGELGEQATKSIEKIAAPNLLEKTKLGIKDPINTAASLGRAASKFTEDTSRLALFLQQRSRGKTPEQAALYVNKWLINYAEKTDFERKVLSRIFPFSTWMTRIVPRIFEGMVRNPQLFSFQEKLKQGLEERVPDEELMADGDRPGWMSQQEFFQMPGSAPGERKFGSLGLPGPDINVLPAPGGSSLAEALKELIGRIGPIKAPVEIAANRNFATQGDIWRNSPGELKPAGGTLAILAESSPDLAQALGMAKQGDAWFAPARLNHVISQLAPVIEQFGKTMRASAPGQLPESDPNRALRNMLWAIPSTQKDTDVDFARRIQAEKNRKLQEARDLAHWMNTQRQRRQQ
jgi:hypothetical protein